MSHQQQLVDYVKQQRGGDEVAARAWLDTHCPGWQSNEPATANIFECEEVADGDH